METMTKLDEAVDGADAVRKFSDRLRGRSAPDRIQAQLDGEAGMTGLCQVEAMLCDRWPLGTAKELVWLTRSGQAAGERLHLRAFAADGEVLCDATFRLGHGDV